MFGVLARGKLFRKFIFRPAENLVFDVNLFLAIGRFQDRVADDGCAVAIFEV
jgi:hypothetical protein